MSRPKDYRPEQGYMYQLLVPYGNGYEHLDHAKDKSDLKHLKTEYGLIGVYPKVITLPRKYWKDK
jgi:hypothetical protein